jgi:putative hydrolase of the HAD superfamily
MTTPPQLAGLVPGQFRDWIFDLDNTLYPADSGLFTHVAERMTAFIAEYFGVDHEEATRLRRQLFLDHGTTLRGLMDEHGLDPDPFLDYVHDIDMSGLTPDDAVVAGLARLKGRKYVFTNASGDYARRILDRIGLKALIDGIFDIRDAGYVPKPAPETYDRMIARLGVDPSRAVMIEDIARNLAPAAALGMTTVWLHTPTPWGSEPAPEGAVHHEIDNLGAWISGPGDGEPAE